MGRVNNLWKMIVNNWSMNGKRILSAMGVCIIAILIALVTPIQVFMTGGTPDWGLFGSKSYDYLTILAVFIVGVVFGNKNGNNHNTPT